MGDGSVSREGGEVTRPESTDTLVRSAPLGGAARGGRRGPAGNGMRYRTTTRPIARSDAASGPGRARAGEAPTDRPGATHPAPRPCAATVRTRPADRAAPPPSPRRRGAPTTAG